MNLPKNRIGAALAASALATALAGTAQAESPAVCVAYANSALAQNTMNLQNQCNIVGLGFSNDYAAHYAFCLIANKAQLAGEQAKRKQALIQCSQQAQGGGQPPLQVQSKYNEPTIGGWRLDWCRLWADQCGAPAANAYCQTKGYAKTVGFALAKDIGTFAPTKVIGTGQTCSGPNCDGFAWITCAN